MFDRNPMILEATPSTVTDTPAESISETPAAAPGIRVAVSLELILYVALVLLSLTLRLAELGTIPLSDGEAHEALAAFRAIEPRAAGSPLVSHNPLMFTANVITMSIGGSDTATARLPTAILGVLLVASPLLFRRWLGRVQALIIAALLAISPVLLLASRSMSGAVWAMALAVVGIYWLGKFIETRRAAYAILCSIALLMLVLMAEPGGFLTLVGLAFGLSFALSTVDDPDLEYRRAVAQGLRDWPWIRAAVIGGFVIALTAMVFLLYPQGLSGIGDVLYQAVRGLTTRPAGYPFAFPLLVSLLYEPVLWVFGLIGAYLVISRDGSFLQRAMVGWLIASAAWALGYGGAEPGDALWLTLPLAALSAITLEKMLAPVRDRFWNVPAWGPYVQGVAVAATLAIAAINLVIVGNGIMSSNPELLPSIPQPILMKVIMVVPALLLTVITFFLVGSMWGARASWHGTGIGVLLILSIYSFGSGWHAAVVNADNPRELWHVRPAARNLNLMQKTLVVASLRATGMPYDMEIVVQPGEGDPFDDGALAWALHRFYNTQFVTSLAPTVNAPVVITADTSEPPKLGAAYVGQDFPLTYRWERSSLKWDFLIWLYDRETRAQPNASDRIVTWVRADIYGLLPESRAPDAR